MLHLIHNKYFKLRIRKILMIILVIKNKLINNFSHNNN